MGAYDFDRNNVSVPPVLEDLLDATRRLRAFVLQGGVPDGVTSGRRMWALADLVEHEATRFLSEWLESVRPCDSCGTWCLTRKVIVEGIGLARSQLCPACAGGVGPPKGRNRPSGERGHDFGGPPSVSSAIRPPIGIVMACMLEVLFRRHYQPLCVVARRYVDSVDGAEDVVQDVFVRLCERPALWQGCKEPRRYLHVAVRNRALKRRKHERVVHKVRDALERLGDSAGMSKCASRPDQELAANELTAAFRTSVDRLPSRRQEAYVRYWDGLGQAEIADGMGISVRTVETHVAQARKAVRQELSDWMRPYGVHAAERS